MTGPSVSIILPTYNRSGLLREAVASVGRQTYDSWELLAIDDGSTDDTPAVLAGFRESRLHVIRLDHTDNPARARNAGLAVARGRYVAFLDDDDLWLEHKLATQVRGLERSGCRWGYTGFRRIDATGQALDDAALRPWQPRDGWILDALLRIEAVVPLPTVMVERTLLAEVGGFDDAFLYCQDYELWFRLAARAPAHVEDAVLTCVRVHPSHRQADRARVNAAWVEVYAKTAGTLADPNLAALSRRRSAEHAVLLARLTAAKGQRRAAIALLIGPAWRSVGTLRWWKALAYAVLPDRVTAVLRRLLWQLRGVAT